MYIKFEFFHTKFYKEIIKMILLKRRHVWHFVILYLQMYPIVRFYSNKDGEIFNFLSKFYKNSDNKLKNISNLNVFLHSLEWEKEYENPIEIATLLGVFADNDEDFNIVMWICLDKGVFIKITPNNADSIIRYLYERFPY